MAAQQHEWRERRVAQILRDFMEAYELAQRLGHHLQQEELDFALVRRLVGDSEESALYRLKEECHALFRFDRERSEAELQAEQLFDLAVGALFHEAMRFREGYYLTTHYGPRLESVQEEGPLVRAFLQVIEAGRQRMRESEGEMSALFDETRDQLVILLHEMSESGAVARSLLEDLGRSEGVFGPDIGKLTSSVFGSNRRAHELAIENLIAFGHYAEAVEMAERPTTPADSEFVGDALAYSGAMKRYFAGEPAAAIEGLKQWAGKGARGPEGWRAQACGILDRMADDGLEPSLSDRASELVDQLRPSVPEPAAGS